LLRKWQADNAGILFWGTPSAAGASGWTERFGFRYNNENNNLFSANGQLKVLSKKLRITNVGLGNRVVRLPQLQQIGKTENCKSKSKNFKFQEVKNGKSFIKEHLQGLS
jgi:hypothetical protein